MNGFTRRIEMYLSLFKTFVLFGLICSCTNNNKTIYLVADNVDRLTTEAIVTVNGLEIGQVEEIRLSPKGQIFIKLSLVNEHQLPIDSRFKVENRDILGTRGISVVPGTDSKKIAEGDTIALLSDAPTFPSDSISIKVKNFLETLVGLNQRDSILYELRRLNRNLEELK